MKRKKKTQRKNWQEQDEDGATFTRFAMIIVFEHKWVPLSFFPNTIVAASLKPAKTISRGELICSNKYGKKLEKFLI